MSEEMASYDAGPGDRPLRGKRIVITRPRAQAARFAERLEELGAEVLLMPTIRIAGPSDPEPLRHAARDPARYDWIVFTSVNGVVHFWSALRESGLDTRALAGVSLCAIGPATAAAIELEGAATDLMPDSYVAEAVVDALAAEFDLAGSRILLPRAEVARSVLPDSLRAMGATVDDVPAYRTVPDPSAAAELRAALDRGEVDLITFTSSSTVRNFVSLVGTDVGRALVASISPITSAVARECGVEVDIEARVYSTEGLTTAIVQHVGLAD